MKLFLHKAAEAKKNAHSKRQKVIYMPLLRHTNTVEQAVHSQCCNHHHLRAGNSHKYLGKHHCRPHFSPQLPPQQHRNAALSPCTPCLTVATNWF